MKIITNIVSCPIRYGYEVPEKFRSYFDYIDDINDGSFFEYRGQWYNLGEFTRAPEDVVKLGWQGIAGDSHFSGILIKLSDGACSVIVGRYYS